MRSALARFCLGIVLVTATAGCKKGTADTAPSSAALAIGQSYGGGIIFYLDNTQLHGLVASAADIGTSAPWDNTTGAFRSPQAYSNSDGAGNTAKIVATFGAGASAAGLCKAYAGGGYSDWFLPSFNQLSVLYGQKALIASLSNYKYWTSTEDTGYIGFAMAIDFGSGQYSTQLKTYNYLVRAIRAF